MPSLLRLQPIKWRWPSQRSAPSHSAAWHSWWDPTLSFDLPPFLTPEPGLNSGLMIAEVTTAALMSENKHLANPCSTDSTPTSANQEDHCIDGGPRIATTRPDECQFELDPWCRVDVCRARDRVSRSAENERGSSKRDEVTASQRTDHRERPLLVRRYHCCGKACFRWNARQSLWRS